MGTKPAKNSPQWSSRFTLSFGRIFALLFSLSEASSKITGNGYFSPFFLSCEDWSHPIALRSNNAIKIAVTGESATVISFISDDDDISEAFDSVIEVLSRTYPSESVRRILAEKSSSTGEK